MNYLTKKIVSVGLLLIFSGSAFSGEMLYANHCYGIKGPLNYHSESYIFSWVKSLGNSEYIFFDRVVERLYKMSGSKISFIENIENRYSISLSYESLNPPFYEEDVSRLIEKGEDNL